MAEIPYSSGGSHVYRSYAIGIITILCTLVILMASLLNDQKSKTDSEMAIPGGMSVYIAWDSGDTDVDLWVQAPDDQPVGYSRTHGKVFDLLRDDQGGETDNFDNFENSFSRLLPAGEYNIGIHYFDGFVPLQVKVEVVIRDNAGNPPIVVHRGVYTLRKEGQEITVINLTLNEKGQVIDSNTLCHPMKAPRCS